MTDKLFCVCLYGNYSASYIEKMTNADKFREVFGIYATELWAKPENEFLKWLNADFARDIEMSDTRFIPANERLPEADDLRGGTLFRGRQDV